MPEDEIGETPAPPPQEDPPEEEPAEEPAEEPEEEENNDLLACSLEDIGDLLTCALEECVVGGFDPSNPDPAGFDLTELLGCAAIQCLPVLLTLPPECADCILEGISGGGTEELLEACAGDLGGLGGGLPGGGGLPF